MAAPWLLARMAGRDFPNRDIRCSGSGFCQILFEDFVCLASWQAQDTFAKWPINPEPSVDRLRKGERDRIPLARRACVAPAHRGVALEHEARVVAAFANGKNFA